tara:strand:+ start:2511 stop:3143 length:633 start_codon:yes stop_codon:yes gene_type:complete
MKRYFITGLLIWVPLGLTAWVLKFLIGTMDQSLLLLPDEFQPEQVLGMKVYGVGTILTLLVVFFTGLMTANIIGQKLLSLWEGVLWRIPVVKSIYWSIKQVSDTIFSSQGEAFHKALLIQYPRKELWTIAFMTGQPSGDVANHLDGDHISVYVPTTPNPTSGFFLMVPKEDIIELDMSVDEALKYIISMGVISPNSTNKNFTNEIENKKK